MKSVEILHGIFYQFHSRCFITLAKIVIRKLSKRLNAIDEHNNLTKKFKEAECYCIEMRLIGPHINQRAEKLFKNSFTVNYIWFFHKELQDVIQGAIKSFTLQSYHIHPPNPPSQNTIQTPHIQIHPSQEVGPPSLQIRPHYKSTLKSALITNPPKIKFLIQTGCYFLLFLGGLVQVFI